MDNLIGMSPKDVLPRHGPTKLLLNKYLWHLPDVGIIAGYTVTEKDVEDHFGVFRGVDQIESFAQATIVSCVSFLICKKQGYGFEELKRNFTPLFISIGNVHFHNYLQPGDVLINVGHIKTYKFRQMACDGRIYKVPEGVDINTRFDSYTGDQLLHYDLLDDCTLIAELRDITGMALKNERFKQIEA